MGFLQAILEIIILVWMFFLRCIEFIFISLMFSVPIWFVYDLILKNKFQLPELHLIHITSIMFIFQLIITVVIIAINKNDKNIEDMKNNNDDNIQVL